MFPRISRRPSVPTLNFEPATLITVTCKRPSSNPTPGRRAGATTPSTQCLRTVELKIGRNSDKRFRISTVVVRVYFPAPRRCEIRRTPLSRVISRVLALLSVMKVSRVFPGARASRRCEIRMTPRRRFAVLFRSVPALLSVLKVSHVFPGAPAPRRCEIGITP